MAVHPRPAPIMSLRRIPDEKLERQYAAKRTRLAQQLQQRVTEAVRRGRQTDRGTPEDIARAVIDELSLTVPDRPAAGDERQIRGTLHLPTTEETRS